MEKLFPFIFFEGRGRGGGELYLVNLLLRERTMLEGEKNEDEKGMEKEEEELLIFRLLNNSISNDFYVFSSFLNILNYMLNYYVF